MFSHVLYRQLLLLALCFVIFGPQTLLLAQQEGADAKPKIATFTTKQDHENMMGQLNITKLRPGPSGNPEDPNASNTDESKANPYPQLPELMTLKDGTKIATAEQWWKQRRPEIIEDFEREVVGRIPDGVPKVNWELLKTVEKKLGETEVIEKRLVGRVDNSKCPEISVNIMMSVVVPKKSAKPVSTLMMFTFFQSWGPDGEDIEMGGRFRGFGQREGGRLQRRNNWWRLDGVTPQSLPAAFRKIPVAHDNGVLALLDLPDKLAAA